ncbi:hypothetical protein TIFTF001_009975 [Ficus carica]|uniref:RINT1-like protein MAG2L n=1 Tax=Ficus carica TaxID=3494 RepID=A0AA88D318_FICCA|nr:hypothetical protein TIFTF001_009975 [Ficus carica]
MGTPALPKNSDLSSEQLRFLDRHFGASDEDLHLHLLLHKAPNLLTVLHSQCSDLDSDLLRLQARLARCCVSWIPRSFAAKSAAHSLGLRLQNLSLATSPHVIGSKRFHGVLGQELPQLAQKVLRIEELRSYLETTLQLEALVGDLEDAVFCFLSCQTGNMFPAKLSNSLPSNVSGTKNEKLLQAIKAMNIIEDMLVDLLGRQPRWHRLLKTVDARVDKTLAVLRPQVTADHRALLVSLGWPPKLSTSEMQKGRISDLLNPLVIMQGQRNCEIRLWAIDELVSPIASRMEYHFSKWVDQPEFMFALTYKITRSFIAGIDDVLQPLIDQARLVSCSATEAWVSAMVQTLSRFLETRMFSVLAEKYKQMEMKSEVIPLWLHLIDLTLTFDKQMQSLVSLGTCNFLMESEITLSRGISLLTIFCDRPEWLKIWAKIELKNACKKLKMDLQDERSWGVDEKHQTGLHFESESEHYLLSTREDHKAPPVAESALKIAWEIIERCQSMPAISPHVKFIRSTATKFLWYFFKVLLLRRRGTVIPPENFNDDALSRICVLINAARYMEFRLRQWSDDVDFLEMKVAESDCGNHGKDACIDKSSFFDEEIKSLSELETNWLMDIIAVILRQFETLSWEYIKQAKHLEEEKEGNVEALVGVDLAVTADFVEALDALRSQLHALKMSLNPKDFSDLWRSVAEGLDQFIFFSNIFTEMQFYNDRIDQFETDIHALFLVFEPFCVRPEAFFPNIREGLKLLKVNKRKS